jgi:predicted amidophosphoribosyltransferase
VIQHVEPPEPAGFGNCKVCPYMRTGTADTCYECASATLEQLPAGRCYICERRLPVSGKCRNPLCGRSEEERGWDWIWAISMRTGPLKRAIDAYKYHGKWGWARIFGRVLVGYLQDQEEVFGDYDLIIPMPTYVGKGGRDRDHNAEVIEWAIVEDDSWPVRTDVMAKTRATRRLAELRRFADRAAVAEREIGPALAINKPRVVRGASVLVFDDVFTGGLTLREVAHKLRGAGAEQVSGIVLARQPYQG